MLATWRAGCELNTSAVGITSRREATNGALFSATTATAPAFWSCSAKGWVTAKGWVMEDGSWRMGHGGWVMEDGSWRMGHGGWVMEDGSWGQSHIITHSTFHSFPFLPRLGSRGVITQRGQFLAF